MTPADLSVVMPNFNHARFLPRALEAILSQGRPAREILVLDDASTDDSVAVIEGFARRHPSIRLIRNERNLGVVATMNRGIELASSRYLLFAAADDYVLPGFFEKCVGLLEQHPRAGLCVSFDSAQFGEGGRIEANPSYWGEAGYYPPDDVCRVLKHTIPGHATICRRDALVEQGGFAPELAWYCDWFALVSIAFRHGACHVPESLSIRVLMPENYSAEAKPGGKNIAVLSAFLELMMQPRCADVAPLFRRSGCATYFGTDLIRAAASREDCWQLPILGFLNGFTDDLYEELLNDPEPTASSLVTISVGQASSLSAGQAGSLSYGSVRELAAFFLGPFWKQKVAQRQATVDEIVHLNNLLDSMRTKIPPAGAMGKLRWLASRLARRFAKSH